MRNANIAGQKHNRNTHTDTHMHARTHTHTHTHNETQGTLYKISYNDCPSSTKECFQMI